MVAGGSRKEAATQARTVPCWGRTAACATVRKCPVSNDGHCCYRTWRKLKSMKITRVACGVGAAARDRGDDRAAGLGGAVGELSDARVRCRFEKIDGVSQPERAAVYDLHPMERLSEHTFTGPPRNGDPGHTTFFLSAGPSSGTPVILVHGWPERAISWKKVMPALAALGLRVVAPDMRGYGRSTVYKDRNRYSHEEIAQDLLELLDHLGAEKAVWIGHDHGSPAVGNLVAHYPERVLAAGFICIPYMPDCMEVTSLAPLVDRKLYPEDQYEFGQWEYQQYYYENFEQAVAQMDSDPGKIVRMLFRRTGPSALGKVAAFAKVRKEGGFFGGKRGKDLPDVPLDTSVLSEEDYKEYVDGLTRNGFLGPDSYYWCLRRDKEWTKSAKNGGKLLFPVLLVHARYDVVAATIGTRLADPMRASCPDLTEFAVDCGHWVPLERPAECAAAVVGWLAAKVPSLWAGGGLQRL